MKFYELSSVQVKEFHSEMEEHFGVRFLSEDNPLAEWVIRAVQTGLSAVLNKVLSNIPSDAFADLCRVRPMSLGDTIILPYHIGGPEESAYQQIMIAVHEVTHSLRVRNYPKSNIKYIQEYFTFDEFRALEESSAQEAEAELLFWFDGTVPKLNLDSYYIGADALKTATLAYNMRVEQIQKIGRGTALSASSAFAISILKKMGVTTR